MLLLIVRYNACYDEWWDTIQGKKYGNRVWNEADVDDFDAHVNGEQGICVALHGLNVNLDVGCNWFTCMYNMQYYMVYMYVHQFILIMWPGYWRDG